MRIRSERLDLVLLTPDVMAALLEGRRADAQEITDVVFPSAWPDEHDARFLRFRQAQVAKDHVHEPFLVRAIALRDDGTMIGHIGFHGKPGVNAARKDNALELGYTVFPQYRRHGYAEEAIRTLVDWAKKRHGVTTFIVSISPENAPSLALARKLGFSEIGSHWDEVDGEELEFELLAE